MSELTAGWIVDLLDGDWGPHGVLSVYVDVDPKLQSGGLPWEITIRNDLERISSELRDGDDRDRWQAFDRRIEEIATELERLQAPDGSGRGRALFASLERKGRIEQVSMQAPLPTTALLEGCPHITPLVAALDEGRPAGVAVLTQPGVEIWNVAMGSATKLHELQLDNWVDQARALGVSAGSLPVSTATDRDPARRDEHRRRFLEWVGELVSERVREHGWDRVLLTGDVRLAAGVQAGLNVADDVDVFTDETVIGGLSAPQLVEATADALEASTRRCEQRLVDQLRATVKADGPAVLGLSQTLALLAEGRVEHLVVDATRELRAYPTGDGWWRAEKPVDHDSELVEHQVVERIIERALADGIPVTPVDPPASEALADVDGIGARLRW